MPVREAQLLTYLRMTKYKLRFLPEGNVLRMKEDVKKMNNHL